VRILAAPLNQELVMPTRAARSTDRSIAAPAPIVAESPAPPAPPTPPPTLIAQPSGYRGLKVWQRAMDLAAATYHVAATMDDRSLADELWRTAIAIPTFIASGNSLYVRAEYVERLSAAHGQSARLECLLHLADRLSALPGTETASLLVASSDIGRMVRALAKALQPKPEVEPSVGELAG
jgi:four helix bundle protein